MIDSSGGGGDANQRYCLGPRNRSRHQRLRCANSHDGKSDDEIRAAMGDKFPKHIYHSIICIGALIAHKEPGRWVVDALGAPHVGERSEKALISSFVDRIAELEPQLITFNGSSFDLPVLRYRAIVHGVAAPGLCMRPYFYRYAEDALDLCDVLSAFPSQGKVTLHELCRVMGLPGKPQGIRGAEVDKYYRDGHIAQIAAYCEGDVVNTYRVWLRYELFRGKLSVSELQASETCLVDFINARESLKLDRVHFHTDAAPDSTLLCPKR
jgi:predicted PolB exonuclease-like 3'-5' exonuclease